MPAERLLLLELCEWLYELRVSQTVRESTWVFPTLDAIHIYSMAFFVMVMAAVDLRLLGFRIEQQPRQPLAQFTRRVLRMGWVAFGVHALSGTLLFAAGAVDYYANSAFRIKISLVLLGVAYHWIVLPVVARREDASPMIIGSKLAGGFGLLLWVGVIAAARWIAYV